ncbi:hypothetical protein [Comamonas sp. JUb58]|uniref:hypothetical protein n=1 Tax=Comamonas sp. JUb58 TaxID=2485114 RepID=UPI00105D9175|nr:hypothetical protein [Comamonas sp. JUb58]TDS84996.1 hypothetical protein EDF71_10190 [Comamonas sp. JUb58]
MYFLTITGGDEMLCERTPFHDYAEAVAACGEFYEPKAPGAVLNFTSVVVRKKFVRSYTHLTLLADLGDVPHDSPEAFLAAKQSNAFSFSRSYVFVIESSEGVREADERASEVDE